MDMQVDDETGVVIMPDEFNERFPMVWHGTVMMKELPTHLKCNFMWGSKEAAVRALKPETTEMMLDETDFASESGNDEEFIETGGNILDPRSSCVLLALPTGENFEDLHYNEFKSRIILYYIRSKMGMCHNEPSPWKNGEEMEGPCSRNMTTEEIEDLVNFLHMPPSENSVLMESVENSLTQSQFTMHLHIPSRYTEMIINRCAPEYFDYLKNKCYFMITIFKRTSPTTGFDDISEDTENIDPNIE